MTGRGGTAATATCPIARWPRFVTAVIAAALTLAVAPRPAYASAGEARFVSLTNGERTSRGLAPYGVSGDLAAVARRHSAGMAQRHTIYHNSRLGSDVSGWRAVGENVGMGGDPDSIHGAFMRSAGHRANILDRAFTQIGVGTAYDDRGVLYVTEVFRQPYASAVAPRPRTRAVPRARARARPRPPAARPDPRAALVRKLTVATAISKREAPRTSLARAFTYVEVMTALV